MAVVIVASAARSRWRGSLGLRSGEHPRSGDASVREYRRTPTASRVGLVRPHGGGGHEQGVEVADMKKTPMTITGAEKLKTELHRLKTRERPRIIQAIAEARAHGDLSENAEYHAAKEQQGFVEGRIAELGMKLATAQVIDPKTVNAGGRVVFGATLSLKDEQSGQEVTYQIVGDFEANVAQGMISISSPIARALIGKELGDVVEVQVPGGVRSYEILDIQYV